MRDSDSSTRVITGVSGTQVAVLALVLGGLLGFSGLLSLCLMVWFSHQHFGVDRSSKHGISVKNTSRMGGVAIALFLVIVGVLSSNFPVLVIEYQEQADPSPGFVFLSIAVGCIGLLDDIGISIKPLQRLIACVAVLTLGFVLYPEWMPSQLLEWVGVSGTSANVALIIISVFVCVGFVNAGNMSDGANGLFSGICLVFFVSAWLLTSESFYFSLSLGLLGFFLINVLTGRIIMGDFGSYGLSTLIALVGFELFEAKLAGMFFLASLLSYPSLEIVRIMIVRWRNGESPMVADNRHTHNLLNEYLTGIFKSRTVANSMTGITIAVISSLPAILLLLTAEQSNESLCAIVFGIQAVLFISLHVSAHFKMPEKKTLQDAN